MTLYTQKEETRATSHIFLFDILYMKAIKNNFNTISKIYIFEISHPAHFISRIRLKNFSKKKSKLQAKSAKQTKLNIYLINSAFEFGANVENMNSILIFPYYF